MASRMEKMESITQCQICLEDMADRTPRALQCLHTFCHDCLHRLPSTEKCDICSSCSRNITNSHSYGNQKYCFSCGTWKSTFQKIELCCPTCRVKTFLPSDGVNGLPYNFLIANIKDVQKSHEGPQKCQFCEGTIAKFFCETCRYYLCVGCGDRHGNLPPFRGHAVQALDMSRLCPAHNLEANYFCSRCVACLCTTCVLSDKHEDHSDAIVDYSAWIADKTSTFQEIKLAVETPYVESMAKLKQLEYFQKNIGDILKKVEETASGMKETIDNHTECMKTKLTQAHDSMKTSVDIMKKFCEDHDEFSDSFDDMTNTQDVDAVVTAETKAIQLQESVRKLPAIEKETWYTFYPGATPCIGELEEREKAFKRQSSNKGDY